MAGLAERALSRSCAAAAMLKDFALRAGAATAYARGGVPATPAWTCFAARGPTRQISDRHKGRAGRRGGPPPKRRRGFGRFGCRATGRRSIAAPWPATCRLAHQDQGDEAIEMVRIAGLGGIPEHPQRVEIDGAAEVDTEFGLGTGWRRLCNRLDRRQ